MSSLQKFTAKYCNQSEHLPFLQRLGQRKFNFGKYKNKTYDEVWEEDKKYVAWIVGKKNHESGKYFKTVIGYYEMKIAEEFGSDNEGGNEGNTSEE